MQKTQVLENVIVAAPPSRAPAKPAVVRPRRIPSVVLAIVAILISSALIGIVALDLVPGVSESTESVRNAAAQRMGEYLFFIGTTHLSLLLLRQKKWIKAKLMFLAGILWVSFHEPFTEFARNLGGDSFSEAQAFDLDEAVFWIQTLHEAITPNFSWKVLLCYLVAAVTSYQALRLLLRRLEVTTRHYSYIKFSLATLIIGVAVHQTVSEPVALFIRNTEVYTETRNNFTNPAPAVAEGAGVDMLVYIGESTSTMNMGIYGYPRDTTPALQGIRDSDPRLLVFEQVFSTHTHTSPSLLEALSFGVQQDDNYLPIHRRRRLSLVDLLEANRIGTTLVSNQGQTGTWNMASSIIFKRARAIYSNDTRKVGNNDDKIAKPWDDIFFQQKIRTAFQDPSAQTRVAFFHSYAGHGGYYQNIPAAYRRRVDQRFGPTGGRGAIPFRERVEEYDAAIRYIDQSVARAIAFVRDAQRPMVLVYFADHGDAPFAGRAHDSSQFIHEMVRVPFMVYFNEAARRRMPATWEKYRALAAARNDATLAQLPSTLLDLLDIRIRPGAQGTVVETPVIGEEATHPPIVVRETTSGLSYVDINRRRTAGAVPARAHAVERSDHASDYYTAARNKTNSASRVCYRGVDSMAKLIRSRLVADCMELAVAVKDDGSLSVSGLAGTDSGLGLDEVFGVAAANRMGVWIHAPDLRTRARCDTLVRHLRRQGTLRNPVLVEFPPGSHANAAELGPCAARLVGMGVATSYYVPSGDAVSCARALGDGRAFGARRSCVRLRNDVAAAHRSGLFTDIGFEYTSVRAMEAFREAGYFRWNTWHMRPDEYSGAASERFKMTILNAEGGEEP